MRLEYLNSGEPNVLFGTILSRLIIIPEEIGCENYSEKQRNEDQSSKHVNLLS